MSYLPFEEEVETVVQDAESMVLEEEELDSSTEPQSEDRGGSGKVCCQFSRRLAEADSESANALLEIALSAEFGKSSSVHLAFICRVSFICDETCDIHCSSVHPVALRLDV